MPSVLLFVSIPQGFWTRRKVSRKWGPTGMAFRSHQVPAIKSILETCPTSNSPLTVAGGFPSGQYKLVTRLEEIRLAIVDGAKEIDTVINRCAALQGKWQRE